MHPARPSTIPECLSRHAALVPDRVFCTFVTGGAAEPITFSHLYHFSRLYAAAFRERGVGRGDVVLIVLRHSPHLFYSFLGAMLAGAIPSFMPFPTPKQRPELYWKDHENLFDRIKPKLLVTYESNAVAATDVFGAAIGIMVADNTILDSTVANASTMTCSEAQPDEIACLQHSSGTTGMKKGVMLTHRAILDHAARYSKALAFTDSDSIVSWLPLYHDMGFIACFMTSVIGGTHLVALDPFEWVMRPQILLDSIERYRPTFCWLPNFAFSHLTATAKLGTIHDLSSIRAFIDCSEPCKARTFEAFVDRFGSSGVRPEQLHVCYAMAENVFAVTQSAPGRPATVLEVDSNALALGVVRVAGPQRSHRLLSCGQCVDGVELRITTVEGKEAGPDQVGEIYISSPFLCGGYYMQPDVTARRFRDGWYATGDMGFQHGGELYVTGRVDDMIIVNGRNYYAHEIEALVSAVPGAHPGRNIALGIDDDRSDATFVVVLAECSSPEFERKDLVRQIRSEVSEHLGLTLHSVLPLAPGSLIKTTSGKISRVKNKELFMQRAFEQQAR